mgnify:CR=1 FL=1
MAQAEEQRKAAQTVFSSIDTDNSGSLTALELSQYVHERYRSDVKSDLTSKGSGLYDDIVMAGRNLGYQHLVVDRGGVAPSDILFAW